MNHESKDTVHQNPSVTRWLIALKDGDGSAAQRLWTFLSDRLMVLAKKEVSTAARVYDEEDVALSAFHTLCHGVHKGQYANITDRGELWRLLAVITINKARGRARHENRIKRGGKAIHVDDGDEILRLLTAPEPPPELAALMQDECLRLLGLLEKEELKMVVLLRVEGYTNEEVARILGCSRRAIQRRLALIRDFWADEITDAK